MTSPDTQPQPEPSSSRRLRRSATDRKVAGVAGGVAEAFDLDPSLVRIAFVVLTFIGGVGLAMYAVGALVIPDASGAPRMSTSRKVILAAIAIAAICSLPFFGHGGFFVAPAVIGLCALGVLAWRAVGGKPDRGLLKLALIVVTFGLALVLGAAAAFATALGGGVIAAIVVIVAGVGLVVGGVMGGARWLIVPAVAMAVPVAVVSAADIDWHGGVGDRVYRPASVDDLRPMYRLGAGRLRVDFRDVNLSPTTITDVKLRVGTGRLVVIAPRNVCVQTVAHAGAGNVELGGHRNDGIDVDASRRPESIGHAAILRLDTRVGLGEIVVNSHPGACAAR